MSIENSTSTSDECGICFEEVSSCLVKTACCRQWICEHCVASDRAYKTVPTCPFCRQHRYEVCAADCSIASVVSPLSQFEGIWDVRVTERSTVGTSSYNATLTVEGDSAHFEADDNHLTGTIWQDLEFGKTPSGKSFCARHRMRNAPFWMDGRGNILDAAGLQGRLDGPNKATFATSYVVDNPRGEEELEITQTGVMTRTSV